MAEEELLEDSEEGLYEGALPFYKRSKLIVFLLGLTGLFVLIILMMLITYLMVTRLRAEQYREVQNIILAPAPPPLATFTFPKEFRVNTADTDKSHFFQVVLHLAFDTSSSNLEIELSQRQSQLMHVINIILSSKKKSDLSSILKRLNLAEEIKSQINLILSNGQIKDIYFSEFIIS